MTENETLTKRNPTVIEQDLFIDPADIDDSDERAFYEKCDFIEQQKYADFPDISRVYIPDFIAEIFERPQDDLRSVEPFEERQGKRYLKWKEEEDGHKEHDYSEGQFQYNPIVFYKRPRVNAKNKKRKKDGTDASDQNAHRLVLKDDWRSKDWLQSRYFALMAPVTYVGKTTENKNARYLYAFTIDLDGVGIEQLEVLFLYFHRTWSDPKLKGLPIVPIPNLIVNSGHGLHLYYIMRYPLALYEWNAKLLQQFIRHLYLLVWYPANEKNGEPGTSTEKKLHCLGIYHAFRMPETLTKPLRVDRKTKTSVGTGVPIQAWKLRDKHYTLSDFSKYFAYNDYLRKTFTPKVIAELERGGRLLNPQRLSLEEARKKYGEEWYQNRDKPKGRFYTNRRLYDWWLKKIGDPFKGGVKEGHRYFCIMALAAFANKCGIKQAELLRDAESLLDRFDKLTSKPDNHFKMSDIHAALRAYDKEGTVRWSPEMIEHWTDIEMKKTKRNRRDQKTHLGRIRAMQNYDDPNGEWRGRKYETLENSRIASLVRQWMVNHPGNTNKSQCARDLTELLKEERESRVSRGKAKTVTSVDRKTVRKWWNLIEEQQQGVPSEKWEEANDKQVPAFDPFDLRNKMQPIERQYQMVLTSEEMHSAMTNPDDPNYDKIWRKTID